MTRFLVTIAGRRYKVEAYTWANAIVEAMFSAQSPDWRSVWRGHLTIRVKEVGP